MVQAQSLIIDVYRNLSPNLVSFGSWTALDGDDGFEELTLLLLTLFAGMISSKTASEKVMCFRAPKSGLQPDRMSTPLLSTNSQMLATICRKRVLLVFSPIPRTYLCLHQTAWLGFFLQIAPTALYRSAGIRTHVSRVAPYWDLEGRFTN